MGDFASLLQMLAMMALVVLGFRLFIRRPRGVTQDDPPGVRTVVVFSGDDREFFRDDEPEGPLVGIRLFTAMLEGLASDGIVIARRRPVDCAQGAECVVDGQRYGLVLEWLDPRWVASVEWAPTCAAERRHIAWTHQVYAPPDSQALRRLLETLDLWLKRHPKLHHVRWHRKERWFQEDATDPADGPFESR
ncbi:MAG: hypothetical protein NUV77_08340 [Thermoguttaceae bacterium]|jgi:hypothetical protein|nr:hypothetical protein [Thermoguttaceae bacterium]